MNGKRDLRGIVTKGNRPVSIVGMMAVLLSAGSNQDVPFERLSGEKSLFCTEAGKSTPVIFSSAYARIMYAALE